MNEMTTSQRYHDDELLIISSGYNVALAAWMRKINTDGGAIWESLHLLWDFNCWCSKVEKIFLMIRLMLWSSCFMCFYLRKSWSIIVNTVRVVNLIRKSFFVTIGRRVQIFFLLKQLSTTSSFAAHPFLHLFTHQPLIIQLRFHIKRI